MELILTLTGSLVAAMVFGYVTQRLKLSPIVGYLLAGVAVGPSTPGFVANRALAHELAEIGVILLMFGVGLQFHFKELLAVRRIALPGALVQSLTATLLGALAARGFGWGWGAGVVLGLSLSVASTVVLVRVLTDNRDLHTPAGHIAVGWLVAEDLLTVVMLVLLPALVGAPGARSGSLPLAIAFTAVKIGALASFTLIVGGRFIPWLLAKIALTGSRELFTLTILAVALAIAVGSAEVFGLSMALGAFLAGMVVGRSEFSLRAASDAVPMRDAFAVLFFVSVGMLLDPRQLAEAPGFVLTLLGVILIGKPAAALAIVLLLRYPLKVALAVAIALAQIGEFSFILAALGQKVGVITPEGNNALIAAAILSIALNPLLYRLVDPLAALLSRRGWFRAPSAAGDLTGASGAAGACDLGPPHRAVVVGYGPIGRTVTRLLRENELEPTVIELNLPVTRRLRSEGISAVYGDATHRDTLAAAGVECAGSLILSSAGMRSVEETIRLARELNPKIRILARSAYLHEVPALRRAGTDVVFSTESEVALAFTEAILRELGASPEQIERERARVHAELLGELSEEANA